MCEGGSGHMYGLVVGGKHVDCAPWWHSEYVGSATLCCLCLAWQFNVWECALSLFMQGLQL